MHTFYCVLMLLNAQVEELTSSLEQERSKMAAVKADHIKQHKMHKNQIHELKEKLAKSEVNSEWPMYPII